MIVQTRTLRLLLTLFASIATLSTSTASAKSVDANFRYKLYTSDVLRWQDGDGPVCDCKRDMASALEDLILNARSTVDFAVFGVYKQTWLLDALRSAKKRGINLRAVVDQFAGKHGEWKAENFYYKDTPKFARILGTTSVVPDLKGDMTIRRGSIMHNKFITVDRRKVWLGSTNLSNTGIGDEYNANMSLLVESAPLTKMFIEEFERMFTEKRFGRSKKRLHGIVRPRKDRHLTYKDGTKVTVFFAPQDRPIDTAVVPFIDSAKHTLDIGMFYLTHFSAAEALVRAHEERGVKVRVLLDAVAAAGNASMHHFLREHGIEVRVENWGGKMHMKSAIADGNSVLVGSMNWSKQGDEDNDESLIIVENNTDLASELGHYFQQLWESLYFYDFWPSDELKDPMAEASASGFGSRPGSINSCFDGVDNNHNSLTDDEDSPCREAN